MSLRSPAIWSIVLAAGEGSRLRSLTTHQSGETIPKQFCSLYGGASLIHETLQRAFGVSSWANVCAVVSARHRRWWQQELWPVCSTNVIVQPQNKGTANGILLPLLHILNRDSHAQVVLLPSDHYVADETALRQSILQAAAALACFPEDILLLGVEPEEADPELGYIVPLQCTATAPARVSHFVEKPSPLAAQILVERGALWNAFIVVARAAALLDLIIEREHAIAWEMQLALDRQRYDNEALDDIYEQLPNKDFSRDILQGMEHRLRVMQVRKCGWSDLGTPQRIERVLQTLPRYGHCESEADHSHLNLAWRYSQLQQQPGRPLESFN